ncbi:hypothetical protein SNE40_002978 [Patella caerulea]|uniref:Uncharacterized protein n=1 Tax=Patella caerulea TaxID=87958 RepID=A0AAN8K754_PATCE
MDLNEARSENTTLKKQLSNLENKSREKEEQELDGLLQENMNLNQQLSLYDENRQRITSENLSRKQKIHEKDTDNQKLINENSYLKQRVHDKDADNQNNYQELNSKI